MAEKSTSQKHSNDDSALQVIAASSSTPKTPSSVRSYRSNTSSKSAVSVLTKEDEKNSNLKVINEETFLDEMGKIIERDFFPDMIDMRGQLGTGVPNSAGSSVKSPGPSSFRCPSRYAASSRSVSLRRRTAKAAAVLGPKINPNLTLNQFLDTYTSEENHNLYKKLKEDSDKFHRIKYKWLYERKNSIINSAFSSPPMNSLMFHPAGLKATKPNMLGVCHRNTRSIILPGRDVSATSKVNPMEETLLAPMATPTPRPGEDGTPLITWGQIKSTPMLLQLPPTPKPNEMPTPASLSAITESTPTLAQTPSGPS